MTNGSVAELSRASILHFRASMTSDPTPASRTPSEYYVPSSSTPTSVSCAVLSDNPTQLVRPPATSSAALCAECRIRELVASLQPFIERNAHCDTSEALTSRGITVFHSSFVPTMRLQDYACQLSMWMTSSQIDHMPIYIAVTLLCRYCRRTHRPLTPLTAHRLLLAAIVLGVKAHSDEFPSNIVMSRLGGVPVKELMELELALLFALQGSAIVHSADVDVCVKELLGASSN